jgi:hypothetical protein
MHFPVNYRKIGKSLKDPSTNDVFLFIVTSKIVGRPADSAVHKKFSPPKIGFNDISHPNAISQVNEVSDTHSNRLLRAACNGQ